MGAGRTFGKTWTPEGGHAKPDAKMFTVERCCLYFQRESREMMRGGVMRSPGRPPRCRRWSTHGRVRSQCSLPPNCRSRSCVLQHAKRHLIDNKRVKENHHVNTSYSAGRRCDGRVRFCSEYRACRRRLWSERLAWYVGPLPLRAAGLCGAASGDLRSTAGFDLCVPAGLLAGAVGSLPRHAVSRPLAWRWMAVSGREADASPAIDRAADRLVRAVSAELIHRNCSHPCGQLLANRDN